MKTKVILLVAAVGFVLSACASTQAKIDAQRAKDPRYQYNLGLMYLNNPSTGPNPVDEAIGYFNKAIALNPKYYLAYNARGLAMIMKGDTSGAIRSFQKCLEIDPAFSEARNNLGSVYESQGLTSLAESEYLKALADETYSTKELPYYNLARMSFALGKYDEALNYVLKSIQFNSRFAMAYNLRGMIFAKMGQLQDAITSFNQAVKLVPDDMNFQFNLAQAYFDSGDKEQAEDIFSLIMSKTTDPELRAKVAEYRKKGK
jgi:tetratricopeptide (TPR) repeat protein